MPLFAINLWLSMLILQIVTSRVFSEELQKQFAALSGDQNPMHMDRVAARRTQAGLPVVHGVHTLLWALESLVASSHIVSPLIGIKVKFLKWVYVGEEAVLSLPSVDFTNPRILKVDVLGMPVLSAELLYGEPMLSEPAVVLKPSPDAPLSNALDLSFDELKNRSGNAFTAKEENILRTFPKISATIGAVSVGEILACSYIVGMEAPGLHSMFSKLDLTIARALQPSQSRAALHYLVTYHDERFRKARIAVTGRSIAGTLEVFMRSPPVEQLSIEAVAAHVDPSEFTAMNALIVGGSRGLGELTAKLIAAGGGTPTITYALGKVEAERVAKQIRSWGGRVEVLQYDVREAPKAQLDGLTAPPTHLFYFATNVIFRPKKNLVSHTVLTDFATFYLHGFHDLCVELTEQAKPVPNAGRKLIVHYPSSIFVEDRPAGMTEYSMIKAAGEQMCRDMNQYLPNLRILTSRLPRLRTDQTAGVVPEREVNPIDVLLPIVREMRDLSNTS
jgi:hypothetical protein